jgi:hypothetical protein
MVRNCDRAAHRRGEVVRFLGEGPAEPACGHAAARRRLLYRRALRPAPCGRVSGCMRVDLSARPGWEMDWLLKRALREQRGGIMSCVALLVLLSDCSLRLCSAQVMHVAR